MKYAETIFDVGRLPLRRRDRAAMQYALEMLRASDEPAYVAFDRAMNTLEEHGSAGPCRDTWCAMWRTLQGMFAEDRRLHIRPLRARLALLLRCLLRVDACRAEHSPGGRYECEDCGSRDYMPGFISFMQGGDSRTRCNDCGSPRVGWTCLIRPLWQDAPGGQR